MPGTESIPSGDGLLQRLVDILHDIVDMFQSDGKADQFRLYASCQLRLLTELRMRCRGRVDGQALCVADIRQVREEL